MLDEKPKLLNGAMEFSGKHRFIKDILNNLGNNWNNNFSDNFDFIRFGSPERDIVNGSQALLEIGKYLDELDRFYSLLEDESSRYIFIQVLSFRILGHRKIKLPLSTKDYWQAITKICEIRELMDTDNYLEVAFPGANSIKLYYADLNCINIPIKLFDTPGGILTLFLIKQYEYSIDQNVKIGAKQGDVVIDGGACWGDSALYFGEKVGNDGMVYTFEFIPDNLKILQKNLSLNPDIAKRIIVVERPLWEASGVEMYYKDNGPGSTVSLEPITNGTGSVSTVSIDDIVRDKNLNKVDFIKMDVEGSEQTTIKGAINTFERFRPQLAISVYHNFCDDFAHIANMLDDLNLGYKFYLGHYTTYHEETVLFATARE